MPYSSCYADDGCDCDRCYGHYLEKKRLRDQAASAEAETCKVLVALAEDACGRKVRIVIRAPNNQYDWMATVNVGGWKMGVTCAGRGDTLAEAINAAACAVMRETESE